MTLEEFVTNFKKIYYVTNCTRYRNFQYRLLVFNIYTNDRLFYWKLTDLQDCSICGRAKDNLIHMLVKCHIVARFWSDQRTYLQNKYSIVIRLTPGNIIFNNISKDNLINFIVTT